MGHGPLVSCEGTAGGSVGRNRSFITNEMKFKKLCSNYGQIKFEIVIKCVWLNVYINWWLKQHYVETGILSPP